MSSFLLPRKWLRMKRHILSGNKNDIISNIDNYVVGFRSLRNREIMKDHFVDGLTFEEVAEKHKMSVRQVKKISYDNEAIISARIREEG